MPLPYPQNLTPDSPPYSTVQINEYWWSVIFGFGDSALERENWDVTDAQWENEVLPAVINALDTGMNCDCIKGLTFDPITGKLTYTNENGDTIEVLNAGDTFNSNNYYVIKANEPNADDAYCYAAHILAERASDDLQDMLEFIDVLEDATISAANEVMASFIDLVPLFGDLAETTLRITDNMAEAMADWVKENARDIQARSLAAEIFYCGIKNAMESGGQTGLRTAITAAAGENLIEFGLSFINNLWEIPDLFDVFDDAYTATDGELLGYAIVAWFLSTDAILDVWGADRPIEAIIAHATTHAAAHDDRDCAGFNCNVWVAEFDFTIDQQGWAALIATGARAVYSAGNGWAKGTFEEDPPGRFPYCQLTWATHQLFDTFQVEFFLTNVQDAAVLFQTQYDTATGKNVEPGVPTDYGLVENVVSVPANDIFSFGVDANSEFIGYLHKMRVWGTGTIPAVWATYEVIP